MNQPKKSNPKLPNGSRIVTSDRYPGAYPQCPHPRRGVVVAGAANKQEVKVLFDDLKYPHYININFVHIEVSNGL